MTLPSIIGNLLLILGGVLPFLYVVSSVLCQPFVEDTLSDDCLGFHKVLSIYILD